MRTSLEGFEEQITGLFLAVEARKKNVVGEQNKLVKTSRKVNGS